MKTRKYKKNKGGNMFTQAFPSFRKGPSTSELLETIENQLILSQPKLKNQDILFPDNILSNSSFNKRGMVNLIRDSKYIKPENKTILYTKLGYEYDPKSNTMEEFVSATQQGWRMA
jgi:hypothetical protein